MPRSTYIYAVEDHSQGEHSLLAVFTVKYEMVLWLKRRDPSMLEGLRVTRHADGVSRSEPVFMGSAENVMETEQ